MRADDREAHRVLVAISDALRLRITLRDTEEAGVGCDEESAVSRVDTKPVHMYRAGLRAGSVISVGAPEHQQSEDGRDHGRYDEPQALRFLYPPQPSHAGRVMRACINVSTMSRAYCDDVRRPSSVLLDSDSSR